LLIERDVEQSSGTEPGNISLAQIKTPSIPLTIYAHLDNLHLNKYLGTIKNQLQNPALPAQRAAQGLWVLYLIVITYLI
jgi:hypothetical protein